MTQNENQLLDVLTREGVLISVSVRYWRATKKLQADDLGLEPDKVSKDLISLGHKKLLPKEALQPLALIEGRAHALIDAGTFPFLGVAHFLPNAKLKEVTEKLAELERDFVRAKLAFLGDYERLRAQARADWAAAAELMVDDPERLVAKIDAAFPSPEKMERSFRFSTQLFQIRIPESPDLHCVDIADQEAVIQARQAAARNASVRIQQGVEQFVGDCAATLRRETATLCEEMLSSMQNGKKGVHQKTLNRLVRFIDEFRQLNFVGDQEMEAQLDLVRREFLTRTAEDYRDNESARERLQGGLRSLAGVARELAERDSRELVERFGQIGKRRIQKAA
jgi:hypothetical protein